MLLGLKALTEACGVQSGEKGKSAFSKSSNFARQKLPRNGRSNQNVQIQTPKLEASCLSWTTLVAAGLFVEATLSHTNESEGAK